MGPVEALVQPLGAAWAGALLVSGLAFRRRAWLAGFTALCLAGGLWLVGGTPFPALLLSRLERPYDRIHPVTLPVADAVVVLAGDIEFSGRELLWFGTGSSFERTLTGLEAPRANCSHLGSGPGDCRPEISYAFRPAMTPTKRPSRSVIWPGNGAGSG
jgi:hypothetical protein